MVGDSKLVGSHEGLADYINDDTTLIIFRIVAFALFPVMMATIETHLMKERINRSTLQQPFYAQCFLAAPFALALSLASTAIRYSNADLQYAGIVVVAVSSTAYIWVQARWLQQSTPASDVRALASTLVGFAGCTVLLVGFAKMIGGE